MHFQCIFKTTPIVVLNQSPTSRTRSVSWLQPYAAVSAVAATLKIPPWSMTLLQGGFWHIERMSEYGHMQKFTVYDNNHCHAVMQWDQRFPPGNTVVLLAMRHIYNICQLEAKWKVRKLMLSCGRSNRTSFIETDLISDIQSRI